VKAIRVSAAVMTSGDKVLVTKRGHGDWAGHWEFPGGKREPSESGEDACVREIREELLFDINVERLIKTVECDYPAIHVTVDFYLCKPKQGHEHLTEHTSSKWATAEELSELKFPPADSMALEEVANILRQQT